MSEYETHRGKLIPVDLEGQSLEDYCKDILGFRYIIAFYTWFDSYDIDAVSKRFASESITKYYSRKKKYKEHIMEIGKIEFSVGYLEWCEIMGKEPNFRDNIIFDAGYTVALIDKGFIKGK